ncbi:MAG: hypothetical protein QM756_07930 [Polyangiaceae bacterium]
MRGSASGARATGGLRQWLHEAPAAPLNSATVSATSERDPRFRAGSARACGGAVTLLHAGSADGVAIATSASRGGGALLCTRTMRSIDTRLSESGANSANAQANCCAPPKRASAFLHRQRATTLTKDAGKSVRTVSMRLGSCVQIACISAAGVCASNGETPVSNSYMTTPSDQISVRSSTFAASCNCSGEA